MMRSEMEIPDSEAELRSESVDIEDAELDEAISEAIALDSEANPHQQLAVTVAAKAAEFLRAEVAAIAAERRGVPQAKELDLRAAALLEQRREAVGQLIRLVWTDLAWIAGLYGADLESAKDIAQKAAVSINSLIQGFDGSRGRFRSWYWSITRHAAADWRKHRARLGERDKTCSEKYPQDDNFGAATEIHLINSIVQQLSEDCRKRYEFLAPRGTKQMTGYSEMAAAFHENKRKSIGRTMRCLEMARRIFMAESKKLEASW